MEKQYYNPDENDIQLPFYCELKTVGDYSENWRVFQAEYLEDLEIIFKCHIRVPYLTKEQIESFGWNYRYTLYGESDNFYSRSFEKELFGFVYGVSLNQCNGLKITKWNSEMGQSTLFNGKCRCVNDFRKILKLLEIK